MQIGDLWHEIKRLWPKSFMSEDHERAWAAKTRQIALPYEGKILAIAWQKLLSEYQKTNVWPGPALILSYCQNAKAAGSVTSTTGKWALYRSWLQWTGRLSGNLNPVPEAELMRLLDAISDSDMQRLGTPRQAAA